MRKDCLRITNIIYFHCISFVAIDHTDILPIHQITQIIANTEQ